MNRRMTCISLKHQLSVRRNCKLLQVTRSRLYYMPRTEKPENLTMMRLMDLFLLEHHAKGMKSMVAWLREHASLVGSKRVIRLLRIVGHHTIYPKCNLSKLGQATHIRPYLLRNMEITHANQVRCTDITYVPMRKGYMYLTAVMDVHSRLILAWGISNKVETGWCKTVLEEAIGR